MNRLAAQLTCTSGESEAGSLGTLKKCSQGTAAQQVGTGYSVPLSVGCTQKHQHGVDTQVHTHFPELLPHHDFLCHAQGFAMTTKEPSLLNVNLCVFPFNTAHSGFCTTNNNFFFKKYILGSIKLFGVESAIVYTFFILLPKKQRAVMKSGQIHSVLLLFSGGDRLIIPTKQSGYFNISKILNFTYLGAT